VGDSWHELFDDLSNEGMQKREIIKAPFSYPGSKYSQLKKILPLLPYDEKYVEPYAGTGIVLLSREPSKIEVLNDRHSGITAFYLCVQDPKLIVKLKEKIEASIHSREFWEHAKKNWHTTNDPVQRGFLWWYSVCYSFASKGTSFGRSMSTTSPMPGKLVRYIPYLEAAHERLKNVTIENQNWDRIMIDYDSDTTVFYLDPPYFSAGKSTYLHNMPDSDHKYMLDMIFDCKGFVALSGYWCKLYDSYPWDNQYSWDVKENVTGVRDRIYSEEKVTRNKDRKARKEFLWIKEFS
jgi:DNA adenine methylase